MTYNTLISLSGEPFKPDRCDEVVRDLCRGLPSTCTKVCLISAYGVGDSLKGSDSGIQLMSSWYLKDTYRSKLAQERYVCALDDGVHTLIVRPRVLTYERLAYNPISTSRQDLARNVLDWIAE